jgi:hypothetical protein
VISSSYCPDTWRAGDRYVSTYNPKVEIEILNSEGHWCWSKYPSHYTEPPPVYTIAPISTPKALVQIGYRFVRTTPEDPHMETDY